MAKKSLGQNFLTSETIAKEIVDASEILSSDTVLEIGPGKGMLTKYLLESGARIVAIEKDDILARLLRENFANEIDGGRLKILNEDVLKFNPESFGLQDSGYKIVANIPYNITGAILKYFLTADNQPEKMILMVQKEVGERILAKPSKASKDAKESVLSISIKAYGKPYIIKNVSKRHFLPKPKVDSVVIKIDRISKDFFQNTNHSIDEKAFFRLVKEGFKERRKKLINNLSSLIDKKILSDILKDIGVREDIRAEGLTLESWREIYLCINR